MPSTLLRFADLAAQSSQTQKLHAAKLGTLVAPWCGSQRSRSHTSNSNSPYTERRPQDTVLHRTLSKGVPAFLAAAAEMERTVPTFVERELKAYLRCGQYEHGFAQVHCAACHYTYLVGFSCKGRGFCPSCSGRRMADLSCHLVDRVLPDLPYRQWVLSFPPPLRYLLAYDAELLGKALQYFIRAIGQHQRHSAKRRYGLRSVEDAVTAAVTVVQRFGSALNLNVHFHTLAPDGVWVKRLGQADELVFRKLGRPTTEQMQKIGWRACQSLLAHLRRTGQWTDEHLDPSVEYAEREPLMAELYGASVRGRLALGGNRGSRVITLRYGAARPALVGEHAPAVEAGPAGYSFDVHAAVSVDQGNRKGLTRLCRYLCRPAAGNERFTQREDGRVAVRLKTAWRDGTTHILLSPLELVEKLVALIPPPRVNMIRFHGAFAPNAAARPLVVPKPPRVAADEGSENEPPCTHAGRQSYAFLMKRVFAIDIEQCRKCGASGTKIQFVTVKEEIDRILRSMGHARAGPDDHGRVAA